MSAARQELFEVLTPQQRATADTYTGWPCPERLLQVRRKDGATNGIQEALREIATDFTAFEDDMAEVGKAIVYRKRHPESSLYYATGQCKH
ncbi:MAG: hypothetical protein JAY90_22605 [Candidatus Thiodiazotropha lotti]|nr:hypothetical protein [Candidatus Thiodiazotropha lotti]